MARKTTWPAVRACGVCRRERRIKRAAVDGDPDMCAACWARDRRSWRVCGRCGELRPSKGRDPEGEAPICERCRRRARPTGVCDRCGRTAQLARTGARGGEKLCGACAERERRPRRRCGRCGQVKPVAVREAADGTRDLCFVCYSREPRRTCGVCGAPGAIHVRGRDGKPDVCGRCYRPPTARCSVCGRERPCHYAGTPMPVCWSCKPRRVAACVLCGEERPVKARSPLGPLCGGCEWRRLRAKAVCERCGQLRRPALHTGTEVLCGGCAGVPQSRVCTGCGAQDVTYYRRLCPACSLKRALNDLRAGGVPALVRQLEPFLQTLERSPNPLTIIQWLHKPGQAPTLRGLLSGEVAISHEALDGLDRGKGTEYLRAALVNAGVLAPRDETVARLRLWIAERLETVDPGEDSATLRRFATWKIARELAARRHRQPGPAPHATTMPRQWITMAIDLTRWLHDRGLALEDLDQTLLDQWLAEGPSTRRQIRRFIAWLGCEPRGLRVPGNPSGTPVLAMADNDRLRALRHLLEDHEAIDPPLRIAGCLVLLYAQPVARIVRLTSDDVDLNAETARIRLGRDPVILPPPLRAALAATLERAEAGHPHHWLFPGLKAGEPTHPSHLATRLKRLGVPIHAGRSSALAALAYRIPASVLADLLGLSAKTTARANGDLKVDYAAYVARRT